MVSATLRPIDVQLWLARPWSRSPFALTWLTVAGAVTGRFPHSVRLRRGAAGRAGGLLGWVRRRAGRAGTRRVGSVESQPSGGVAFQCTQAEFR